VAVEERNAERNQRKCWEGIAAARLITGTGRLLLRRRGIGEQEVAAAAAAVGAESKGKAVLWDEGTATDLA
jgi:hypothetical protein